MNKSNLELHSKWNCYLFKIKTLQYVLTTKSNSEIGKQNNDLSAELGNIRCYLKDNSKRNMILQIK